MNKKILAAEHLADVLKVIRSALEDYEVFFVSSGADAVGFLEQNEGFDLFLLSTDLPGMTGREISDIIRKKRSCRSAPIVFLTDDGTETGWLEQEKADFIRKPFSAGELRLRVARALELGKLRENPPSRPEQEVAEILDQATRDPLTGLRNRTYTVDAVNEHIREGIHGTLLMIDLDNFKQINDIYGHLAGDEVLKELADILRRHFRGNDILCRIGGDEFLVFVSGLTNKGEIRSRAASIIGEIDRWLRQKGYDSHFSLSIGISQTPSDGNDFNTLYQCADKALYHVKQNGKHDFYFYGDKHEAEVKRASGSVDIHQIEAMLERLDAGSGAYLLDYGAFPVVYNFIRRFVERNGRDVQFVLFTVMPKDRTRKEAAERSRSWTMPFTFPCAALTLPRATPPGRSSSC